MVLSRNHLFSIVITIPPLRLYMARSPVETAAAFAVSLLSPTHALDTLLCQSEIVKEQKGCWEQLPQYAGFHPWPAA
jgi:hypothetical protein